MIMQGRRGDETTAAASEKTSRKIFGFLDNKSLKFGLWRPLLLDDSNLCFPLKSDVVASHQFFRRKTTTGAIKIDPKILDEYLINMAVGVCSLP